MRAPSRRHPGLSDWRKVEVVLTWANSQLLCVTERLLGLGLGRVALRAWQKHRPVKPENAPQLAPAIFRVTAAFPNYRSAVTVIHREPVMQAYEE